MKIPYVLVVAWVLVATQAAAQRARLEVRQMPKRWGYACVALLIGFGSAYAQQPLTTDEIKALVVGKEFRLGTVGIVEWKADGRYSFLGLNGGGTSRGKYSITEDRICVDFDQGWKRCDQITKDGGKYYFKSSRGSYEMFPR